MALVTLSAPYGAGGSEVGPRLAERLGVPFLDRAIPTAVADRLAVPLEDALDRDEMVSGLLARLLAGFAPAAQAVGGAPPPVDAIDDREYLDATEHVIRERAASGGGVFLGRAAALVLRDEPHALHVRLDGPRERRCAQAAELEGVDRQVAERRQAETDRARDAYWRHFYRCDQRDVRHYHLVIDSTALGLDACVDVIARAAEAREQAGDAG
jgi:cytidylate kinase